MKYIKSHYLKVCFLLGGLVSGVDNHCASIWLYPIQQDKIRGQLLTQLTSLAFGVLSLAGSYQSKQLDTYYLYLKE